MEYNISFRQKDGGWQYNIGFKVDGKWKYKSKQGFKTKKEAKLEADKRLVKLKMEIKYSDNIVSDDYSTITFEQLFNVFINHIKLYKEGSTLENYKFTYAKVPELYEKKVNSITKLDIQNVVDRFILEELKGSTIETYIKRLKQIFLYYKTNYNNNYKLPTENIQTISVLKSNKRALTLKEIDYMLKDIKENKSLNYIIVLLCVKCGLRRGEALGVTWNDIDFKNMTINIDKQWKKLKDGTWGFGETKNKKHRIIPVSQFVIKELLEYRKNAVIDLATNRVTSHSGMYISQTLNKELKKYDITIHELRHSYATNLIAAGIDFKTVAALIGDNVRQVIETYSHVHDEMMDQAKNVIQNIF